MNHTKAHAFDNLLDVCLQIRERFQDGHMPTFDQMNRFQAAVEYFEFMLICGHRVVDECDCGKDQS